MSASVSSAILPCMPVQVKDKNGLLVISTSFHDSRRSANQLKGRAGRQGDPGETLTLYDFDDEAFQANGAAFIARSEPPYLHRYLAV